MADLRVATLNCLNLGLPGRVFYPGMAPYSDDEYRAKTHWLAALIARVDADILLVQEVFDALALADVVAAAAPASTLQFAAPLADRENTLPRLGAVWRAGLAVEIDSIAEIGGVPVVVPERGPYLKFSRPLLRLRAPINLPDGRSTRLTLFNVHLKSKRAEFVDGEDPADPNAEARAQLRCLLMRAAEAVGVRRLVVEAMRASREPLIVGGDFNDGTEAVTTQMIADTSWRTDDRPARDIMLFDALAVEQRRNLARGRDTAFTILHAGEPERIDHLYVSEELVAQSKYAIGRIDGVEIFNDHLAERRRPRRRRIDGFALDPERIFSDHAALAASIIWAR